MGVECPKCHSDNTDTARFCSNCATPLPSSKEIPATKTLETPTEELTTGSIFAGRYQIIEVLGKGGMGKVYRALDKKLNEEVALKLIKPEIASDKKTLERFNNELKFARKIAHKNVGRMYEVMEEKGTHFITMEYVPGQDLRGLIRQSGQLAVGTAVSIAKQVCEGLTEAHRLGVIHRDLKPQNIMIDKEGMSRIMDFGIARSVSGKGITGAGVMVGTPEYMSPEQVESKETDQRSDIYSLGVILYEMVTGRVPFEGDTPLSVAVKHKTEAPQDPRELNAQVPEDLSRVILRCMEKSKDKRYQSSVEVRSELINIEKGIPTTERVFIKKEPKTVKIGEIKWRNIFLYGGGSIILIVLIMLGIFLLTGRQKVMDSIAILPFENISEDPELDYLSDGITESIIDKLTQLPSMKKVIARSSVFRYKGKEIDPQIIGQELGVDAVLISRMNQRGDELSISVELVDTEDNSRIWGNQYKQNISGIFAIQEDITNSITQNLKLKLTGEELESLAKRSTENSEAYDFYLRGRYFWIKRTKDGFYKAIEYYEKAIGADPNLAQAYSGLADSYSLLSSYGYLQPNEGYPLAKEAALNALSLDDTLAEAYASLARIKHQFEWDWSGSERDFIKALELKPGCVNALQWYSTWLGFKGRHDEAIKTIKKALEMDPLSIIQNRSLGRRYLRARLYDKAIEALQKTLEMDPDYPLTRGDLGIAYLFNSMYEEALEEFQKANSKFYIAITYAKMGNEEKVKELLSQYIAQSKVANISDASVAKLYFTLGENDKGFEWFQKAYEEREGLLSIKIDPLYDSVRSDPRFKEILKKMNLE
jgi:serine/threonine protein kinase